VGNVISSWHVGVAAEAVAAAQFARCGFDVLVQYGANQPEYDLVVVQGDKTLKVSVKGSQDGGSGLTQSYLENADYHTAINTWLERHKGRTVFCFVQFQGTPLDQLPRLYLATPREVADQLRRAANGRRETVLWEHHVYGPRSKAAGAVDEIPHRWRFTKERAEHMLRDA
jgi:hypothetical protein